MMEASTILNSVLLVIDLELASEGRSWDMDFVGEMRGLGWLEGGVLLVRGCGEGFFWGKFLRWIGCARSCRMWGFGRDFEGVLEGWTGLEWNWKCKCRYPARFWERNFGGRFS
jgi:hypothetical protein